MWKDVLCVFVFRYGINRLWSVWRSWQGTQALCCVCNTMRESLLPAPLIPLSGQISIVLSLSISPLFISPPPPPPPPITPHVCSAGMSKGLIKSALTSLAISFYPEFGMWTRGRFWTLWSITTRPCSTCDSVTGWWSPARRIAPSPCGTWPLPQTSASAESSSDTGPPSMWSTLTTSTLSLPLVIGP